MIDTRVTSDSLTSNKWGFRVDGAILLALLPLVAGALRVWLYSAGDPKVFFVLLRTIDIPTMLLSTVVMLVPSLIFVWLVGLLLDWRARGALSAIIDSSPRWLTIAVPVALIVFVYTTAWPLLLVLVVTAVLVFAVALIRHHRPMLAVRWRLMPRSVRLRRSPGPDTLAMVLTACIVFLITPANMWLPRESLTLRDGSAVQGYVLEATSEWTTVLSSDRRLIIQDSDQFRSRDLCDTTGPPTFALLMQGEAVRGSAEC